MGRAGLIIAGVVVVVLLLALSAMMLMTVDEGTRRSPDDRMDRIRQMDINEDGIITWDEFEGPERMFDRFDADGNGEIDSLELEEVRRRMEERMSRGGGDRDGRPGRRTFEEIDTNGDGVITADEFAGPPEAFERIDADADSQITAEELSSSRLPERSPKGQ